MKKILVVEDSDTQRHLLVKLIQRRLHAQVDSASSYQECAERLLHADDYFACLTDLNLPDATDGSVVHLVMAHHLPTIVLTSTFDRERRMELLNLGAVDYIIKDSKYAFNYAINLLQRLYKNRRHRVLVVDDSLSARNHIRTVLERLQLKVEVAHHGAQALAKLREFPDIRLMLTDYDMPEMNGIELVTTLREEMDKQSIAIIGISSSDDKMLSANFIKRGANDFLSKPFAPEELQCRVTHNLETLELLDEIQDTAHRDFLTQLYNRRYLFEQGTLLYRQSVYDHRNLSIAILDLDHFKAINDGYGHDAGDEVLRYFAHHLASCFPNCLTARFGGEEFCVLIPNLTNEQVHSRLDRFRAHFASLTIPLNGEQQVHVTVSGGVTTQHRQSFETQLKRADELLYLAKEHGRNQIIADSHTL